MSSHLSFLSHFLLIPLLWCGCAAPSSFRSRADLGNRLVVGYWHNWKGEETPYVPLDQLPEPVNRVNVAFAIPAAGNDGTMEFVPNRVTPEVFRAGVLTLRMEGVSVLISVGGGNHPVELHTPAMRDRLDVVHLQFYNSGSQYLYTGVADPEVDLIAEQGTVDFVVGLTEMLILGFPVARDPENPFPGLGAEKVAIGLPASPSAAKGGGFLPPKRVRQALDTLMGGRAARGSVFRLRRPGGHPGLRGLMTWSINWDVTTDGRTASNEFARNAAETLSGWNALSR